GIDYLPALPCGACRQVMAETESRQCREMRILAYRSESEIWIFSGVESLLPFAFSM
ncbi:MAG: cytidine deaminase, partial [Bacteroidales bacterium]|nr:cytidine deaminase [Bacteroidales bacterium]